MQNKIRRQFNPLTTNVPHHIETSQLIWNANQLTGFYMMGNIGRQWVKVYTTFTITLTDILTRGLLEYVIVNHSSLVFTCLDCNKNYEKDFDED